LRKLIEGLVEFREHQLPQYAARLRELSDGQEPATLFVTCSDSRIVPNLLVSSDPGDMFMMRNVGNLIPPAHADGASTGDLSEASAVEYAVHVLEVRDVVVCGHSGCGAMEAALSRKPLPKAPNLALWLAHADPAVRRLQRDGPLDPSLRPEDQLSQLNVLVQMEHLMTYPAVRERAAAGALRMSGWWFNIANGDVSAYEPETRSFEVLDRREADRLLARLDDHDPRAAARAFDAPRRS
jgi:carbonic anhydrase